MNTSAASRQKNRSRSLSNRIVSLLVLSIGLLIPIGADARGSDDFSATWIGTGDTFSLEQVEGEVILLNLWATWCQPCQEEMPEVNAIAQEFAPMGLRVIGVNIDRTLSDADVLSFAKEYGAEFEMVRDRDNTFSSAFRTTGVPETVLIDRNGKVVFHWNGQLDNGSSENRQIIGDVLSDKRVDSSTRISSVGYFAAFGAGLLSLLSPCLFPLIPTYAAWMTGVGAGESRRRQGVVLRNGLLFVTGFSLVFIALGASTSMLGGLIHDYRDWIGRIGGVVLIGFGMHRLGLFRIGFLDRIVQPRVDARSGGAIGTFVVGVAFGASWTPCIGPILASILTIAAASARPGQGVALLTVYSLGLAIPFLISTVFIDRFMKNRSSAGKWLPILGRVSGVLILVIGALMISGLFSQLSSWSSRFDPLV